MGGYNSKSLRGEIGLVWAPSCTHNDDIEGGHGWRSVRSWFLVLVAAGDGAAV